MITKKYYKLIRVSYADEGYFCLTNVSNNLGNVKLDNKSGGGGGDANYEYSTDGVTWNAYTLRNNVQVDPNSNIYWRYAGSGNTINGSFQFYFDFDCYASGNLMSLFSKTDFATYTGTLNASGLFTNQTHLLRADFNFGMVSTIEGGIYTGVGLASMFQNCTALTTAPDLSNITSVGQNGMYGMFQNCSALTTAPDLSNITSVGQSGMQNMFTYCSSLTTGPNLRNITSVGQSGMQNMFQNCSLLTTVYAPTITWDISKTSNWLFSAAASGTIYADASIASTIPTNSIAGCPNGWTIVSI